MTNQDIKEATQPHGNGKKHCREDLILRLTKAIHLRYWQRPKSIRILVSLLFK